MAALPSYVAWRGHSRGCAGQLEQQSRPPTSESIDHRQSMRRNPRRSLRHLALRTTSLRQNRHDSTNSEYAFQALPRRIYEFMAEREASELPD